MLVPAKPPRSIHPTTSNHSIINNSSSRRWLNRYPSSHNPINRGRTVPTQRNKCHSSSNNRRDPLSKWASSSTSRPCLDKMPFMCRSLRQTPSTWREFQSMQQSEKFLVSSRLPTILTLICAFPCIDIFRPFRGYKSVRLIPRELSPDEKVILCFADFENNF